VIIEFDRFELDTEQKIVAGPDGPINLRPQTFAVLCYLIEKAPAVVSRDEVLDAVWGHQATSVSSVAQTIKELRHALGDPSREPRLIATRRRLGYQFIGEIHTPIAGESGSPPVPEPVAGNGAMPEIRLPSWPGVFILLAVLAVLAVWIFNNRIEAPVAERLPTLAVAQMVNASDDPNLNWLGPALETYLGHALVELGGFRVLNVNQRALADESQLNNVDFLVEGRYLTAGVDGPSLLASLRRPGTSELVTSVESSFSGWDVASLAIDTADAIRDRLGFSMPPAADPGTIRSKLPREPSSQRAYFRGVQAISRQQPNLALFEIERARANEPDNPRLDHLEALAQKQRGNWQAAREASEKAMTATRLWPLRDRLELEATAALLDFDHERAADRLQALTQFFPEPGIARRMVEALIDAGRLRAADEALQSLRLQYPADPRGSLLGARLAQAEGDHEGRLNAAREAVVEARAQKLETLLPPGLLSEAGALIELGRLEEARAVVDELFGLTDLLNDADLATVHLILARIQFQQGELPLALASAEQARSLFEVIPHPAGVAETLMVAGAVHDRSGNVEASIDTLQTAVDHFETLGDKRRLARSNVLLGVALMGARRTDAAVERLELGAQYFRAAGDRQGEGGALLNHATLLARSGRLEDAEPIFQRGLEAFVDAGDLRGQAIALSNLAAIAGSRRDVTRSIQLSEQALGIFETLGAQTDIARVSYNLALSHRRRGELLTAERRIEQSANAFAGQGAILMQSRALATLSSILIDMGRLDEVEAVLATLNGLDIQDPVALAGIHAVRGDLALAKGEPESALAEFQTAHDLLSASDSESHLLVAKLNLARAELARGLSIQAEQTARQLLFDFGEVRQVNRQVDALLLLAEALIEQNRIEDAQASLSQAEQVLADSPDVEQQLRLALLRGYSSSRGPGLKRLEWVAETAGRQGFRPLMEQAEALLADRSN